jgi:dTDP-4-amino-4,6-dideoxy-D-glucose ammonia-lyase
MRVGYSFDRYRLLDRFENTIGLIGLDGVSRDIVIDFCLNPFIKQEELAVKYKLTQDELLRINQQLRNNEAVQDLITEYSPSSAYWLNTIIPLCSSHHFKSALENKYAYPNRIGLHPGMSCMFYCHFCPRNYYANYTKEQADHGYEVFKRLIDEDPKDTLDWPDRFRISGGHEPLTNPHVPKLISYAKERGFRMQIYTNGHNLTKTWVAKNPGIWDLHALRVSMYGVDDASYLATTQKPNSYSIVRQNIVDFLRAAKERNSTMKIGVNWIILPGLADHVSTLINLIRDIGIDAGRQIDFLTLREDYSPEQPGLTKEDRLKLIQIFDWIKEEQQAGNLTTKIDYGYALTPLLTGYTDFGNIMRTPHTIMDSKGFPQLSLQVDSIGSAYVYHGSAYLGKPGADKYIIGTVGEQDLATVVRNHIEGDKQFAYTQPDLEYLDSFDNAATLLLDQIKSDRAFGIDWNNRLIKRATI